MDDPRRRPGGQGINAARAARVLGGSALAVAPLGGRTGTELFDALRDEGTPCEAVWCDGETRTFVAVRDRDTGRSLLLNARGPARTAADQQALEHRADRLIRHRRPAWVAGCGSLPRGFTDDFYSRLAARAHAAGSRFIADCDGAPLRDVAHRCDLLLPNHHEAARLLGSEVRGVREAAAAARSLLEFAPAAAITLGALGAVLATADRVLYAGTANVHDGSAVGAGDVFLAALVLALHAGAQPDAALARAVAAATATLHARGTDLVRPADADRCLRTVTVGPAG